MFFIFAFIYLTSLHAITLEFAENSPTIIIENNTLESPFFGGFNKPKVQWIDWDHDTDIDLFLLDEGGSIRF